ncbi:MAG: 2Fe-2S ferredoxin-like protein [Alcaligenaceae bacterium]|nr:2Fe-2S ferredoxin-like protein [Alcaligenaceae bacterium]
MTTVTTTDLSFSLLQGESLLDGLERTGHEVEYQCRSGYCGACRLTLLDGSVSYAEPPLAFIGQSEILPCCCTVTGPIRIECRTASQAELPLETEQQVFDF